MRQLARKEEGEAERYANYKLLIGHLERKGMLTTEEHRSLVGMKAAVTKHENRKRSICW